MLFRKTENILLFPKSNIIFFDEWSCRSVVEHFPGMRVAQGSVSSTIKDRQTDRQEERDRKN